MIKLLVLFCVFCICTPLAADPPNKPLRNKVRITDADTTFRFRIVDADADVNIHPINGGPELNALIAKAGTSRLTHVADITPMGYQEWEFVDQGEEFSVKFVDKDEHLTVKFVFDTIGALSKWEADREARRAAYAAERAAARAEAAAREAEQAAAERAAEQAAAAAAASSRGIVDCKCKGIPLHGYVKVVDHYVADFHVLVVDSAPADLYVLPVDAAPYRCGEWQFVESGEDFTVQLLKVAGGEDFTVQFVDRAGGEGTR